MVIIAAVINEGGNCSIDNNHAIFGLKLMEWIMSGRVIVINGIRVNDVDQNDTNDCNIRNDNCGKNDKGCAANGNNQSLMSNKLL